MRLAAAVAALALCCAPARAEESWPTWRDQQGLLSFAYPQTWHVNPMRSQTEGAVRMVTGSATFECQIWSLPRESTIEMAPDQVRERYAQALSPDTWAETVHELPEFRANLVVTPLGIETVATWPVQRVELISSNHRARATASRQAGPRTLEHLPIVRWCGSNPNLRGDQAQHHHGPLVRGRKLGVVALSR